METNSILTDDREPRTPMQRAYDESYDMLEWNLYDIGFQAALLRAFQMGWMKRGQSRFFAEDQKHLLPNPLESTHTIEGAKA